VSHSIETRSTSLQSIFPARDRFALFAVPALLIAVALLQIGRAAVLDQSSYAGFGFGMFATYENELSRWTEIHVTDTDGDVVRVGVAAELDLAAQEVPTAANIELLAKAALEADKSYVSAHAALWSVEVAGRPMQVERILLGESSLERSP